MPALDESHDDRIRRILQEAGDWVTAQQITDKIHAELGGGLSYTAERVAARLANLAGVQRDGDRYRL